jgi:hypothetical protein
MNERIILGTWSEDKVDRILRETSELSDPCNKIAIISKEFLHTPYNESTLIGDADTSEVFVINLEQVDCFTYLDYVEAMRLSTSFTEFKENLASVRYHNGEVHYAKRNHFFTDWRTYNANLVKDVTADTGKRASVGVVKQINDRGDGTYYLPGVHCNERVINYIPTESVDGAKLQTGDYIGIYSDRKGLDVSHVGIFLRDGTICYLRHASSRHMKVVDEDFREYIKDKPGILIFRAELS